MKILYISLVFLLTSCFSEELLNSGLTKTLKFNILEINHQVIELNTNSRKSEQLSLIMHLKGSNDFQYSESWVTIPDSIEVDIPNNIQQLEVFFTTYTEQLDIFKNVDEHFYIYHQIYSNPTFDTAIDVELKIASTEIEVIIKKPERIKEIFFNIDTYIYDMDQQKWVVDASSEITLSHATAEIYFPLHVKSITLTRYLSEPLIIDVDKYMEPGTKNILNIDNKKAGFRIAFDSSLIENTYNYKVKD